jgi:hypothetical protein
MNFTQPSNLSRIPTYRVMDSEGVILDKDREVPDVTNEQAVTWYKNMLTGSYQALIIYRIGLTDDALQLVNILDSIMYEAQRQGRLSFYMVRTTLVNQSCIMSIGSQKDTPRCRRVRKAPLLVLLQHLNQEM